MSDVSFLRQCAEKIATGEVWSDETPVFLQCVTYSGHSPFILPDELKRITFSQKLPEVMEDYITMANFTDYAIGILSIPLKSRGGMRIQ
ncbi:MAG: hypothetical protein LUD02_02935 [Tannerellaceae bacterium]|nr:hypothetical protein [Tannerellaceae bacterium]MCD8263226.1 hypothetical protein [Tannerellaceae bacterium]